MPDSWHRGVGEGRGCPGRAGAGGGGQIAGASGPGEARGEAEILAGRRGGLSRREPKRLWGRSGCEHWCARGAGHSAATAGYGNPVSYSVELGCR